MLELTNPIYLDADKAREHFGVHSMAGRSGVPPLWQLR